MSGEDKEKEIQETVERFKAIINEASSAAAAALADCIREHREFLNQYPRATAPAVLTIAAKLSAAAIDSAVKLFGDFEARDVFTRLVDEILEDLEEAEAEVPDLDLH